VAAHPDVVARRRGTQRGVVGDRRSDRAGLGFDRHLRGFHGAVRWCIGRTVAFAGRDERGV
jgi:hypothetical protein